MTLTRFAFSFGLVVLVYTGYANASTKLEKAAAAATTIRVFYDSALDNTNTPIAPSMLLHDYQARMDLRSERDLAALRQALRATHPQQATDIQMDARWGLIFLDAHGRELGKIFLNGNGELMQVDGRVFLVRSSPLAVWLGKRFSCLSDQ